METAKEIVIAKTETVTVTVIVMGVRMLLPSVPKALPHETLAAGSGENMHNNINNNTGA